VTDYVNPQDCPTCGQRVGVTGDLDEGTFHFVGIEAESVRDQLKRHVNHADILILDDGIYCAQCGGHVIEWGGPSD
jgi:hypothetical protein